MNTSSDAAETIFKMYLEGTEFLLKTGGSLTKNCLVGLYALSKDQKKSRGKTTLSKMLKTGKELKIFTIKKDDLKLFQQEAKRYGVLFTALFDKKNPDGKVDIMCRAEDAAKINRIINRFKLVSYDEVSIKSEIMKTRDGKEANDKGVETKSLDDLVDDLMSKPVQKEENTMSNPELAKTAKSPQSERSSTSKNKTEVGTNSDKKPSVREEFSTQNVEKLEEEIKNIKEEQKQKAELEKSDFKKDVSNKETKHEQPKNKKKKSKERGK